MRCNHLKLTCWATFVLAIGCGDDRSFAEGPDPHGVMSGPGALDSGSERDPHDVNARLDAALDNGGEAGLDGPDPMREGDSGAGDGGRRNVCGDRVRDPTTEQCDDGPGEALDPCTSECRLRDVVFATVDPEDPDEPSLFLGAGPHAVVAGDSGLAIAYVKAVGAERSVWLARFDPWGTQLGPTVEVSAGASPTSIPDPVVGALPEGGYAVVWGDNASGTPDLRMRRVDANGDLGSLRYVHDGSSGTQQHADLLWIGEELIAAYSENFDIRVRRFDSSLQPLAAASALTVNSTLDTSVSLAPFGEGYAVAWCENDAGSEWIHVRAGDSQWAIGPVLPVPELHRPKVAALDETRLLLVFGEGTDPEMTGSADVARLRWAVLSSGSPGQVESFALQAMRSPYDEVLAIRQGRASMARVGTRTYLGWESGDTELDVSVGSWWTQISSSTETDEIVRSVEDGLQVSQANLGEEAQPVFGASPLEPQGALIAVWESSTSESPSSLIMALRPSPFIE